MATSKKRWITYGIFGVVLLAVYFINVEVQSYLGRQALRETGLKYQDLAGALAIAAAESKPVLVEFSAIWCPSCRKLDQKVFSDEAVIKVIDQTYVFARVEYESAAGEAFQKKYGAKGFPRVLILDSQANLEREIPLSFDPTRFLSELTAAGIGSSITN